MRTLLATGALVAAISTSGIAQHHEPKFLSGGYSSTSTLYTNGVWLGDARAQTYRHLTPNVNVYYGRTMRMDANNKDVIFTAEGTTSATYASWLRSGLYRVNPGTGAISTIYHSTLNAYAARHVIVNQDGDYVFTFDEQEFYSQHEDTGEDVFVPVRWGEGGFATIDIGRHAAGR